MNTNIAKLKRGKGAPPPADVAPDVVADDTRPEKAELRPLQVRIPRTVFEEFSERCVFRGIRPVIPTTSGHLNRGIRPPLFSGFEA